MVIGEIRRTTGRGIQARLWIRDVRFGETRILDRLDKCAMGKQSIRRHRAQQLPLDFVAGWKLPIFRVRRVGLEFLDRANHLARYVGLLKRRIQLESVPQLAEVARYGRHIVADAGDKSESGDENF